MFGKIVVRAQNVVPGHGNFVPQQIWQRNYYEHIIRNDQSYQAISDYIVNYPAKRNNNEFFYV